MYKRKHGFTFVEVLVVIAIILILVVSLWGVVERILSGGTADNPTEIEREAQKSEIKERFDVPKDFDDRTHLTIIKDKTTGREILVIQDNYTSSTSSVVLPKGTS